MITFILALLAAVVFIALLIMAFQGNKLAIIICIILLLFAIGVTIGMR